jgi:predicted transposase YbfD/YdcC
LTHVAVADKANEIGTVLELLSKLVVEGYFFTTNALLTQRELAREILKQGVYGLPFSWSSGDRTRAVLRELGMPAISATSGVDRRAAFTS